MLFRSPLTKPFDYITLNGKLTLYARKDAAEQLRKINNISIEKPDISFQDEWIIVTVAAYDGTGRRDSDVGVVNKNDMSKNFGNALMKAITKAKRRVTLSISGLGMLDETEIDSIPNVKVMPIDDFEIIDAPKLKGNGNGHKPVRAEGEILEELGYDPDMIPDPGDFTPKMTKETAGSVTTSEGKRYGDLDNKAWQAMERNITIKLHRDELTPEQKAEYQYKLDALQVLLYS